MMFYTQNFIVLKQLLYPANENVVYPLNMSFFYIHFSMCDIRFGVATKT